MSVHIFRSLYSKCQIVGLFSDQNCRPTSNHMHSRCHAAPPIHLQLMALKKYVLTDWSVLCCSTSLVTTTLTVLVKYSNKLTSQLKCHVCINTNITNSVRQCSISDHQVQASTTYIRRCWFISIDSTQCQACKPTLHKGSAHVGYIDRCPQQMHIHHRDGITSL